MYPESNILAHHLREEREACREDAETPAFQLKHRARRECNHRVTLSWVTIPACGPHLVTTTKI